MSKEEFDLDKLAVIDDYRKNHANPETFNDVIPTRDGLAAALDVSRATIERWEEEEDDVRVRLEKMDAVYRNHLVQEALKKNTNSTTSIRLMEKEGIIDSAVRRGKKDDVTNTDDEDIPPITKGMSEEEAARINERRRARDRKRHQ